MSEQARLLVIDYLLPQPGDESAAAQAQVLDDLNMSVRTGGHGRRASNCELFASVGLQVTNVLPLGLLGASKECAWCERAALGG